MLHHLYMLNKDFNGRYLGSQSLFGPNSLECFEDRSGMNWIDFQNKQIEWEVNKKLLRPFRTPLSVLPNIVIHDVPKLTTIQRLLQF